MTNNIEEAVRLYNIVVSASKDPLKSFVAQVDADQLHEVRKLNLQRLFEECKRAGMRYIYVGTEELCGCEGIRENGSPWPAIWRIAEKIGFPGSCGNSDQCQCSDAYIAFPKDAFGGWDLKENRKLTDEEVKEKQFRQVIGHFRKPREIPFY